MLPEILYKFISMELLKFYSFAKQLYTEHAWLFFTITHMYVIKWVMASME